MGSHLDTQPTGGKFDGVLGVLGALEVVRSLNDLKIRTKHSDRRRQLDQRRGFTLRAGDGFVGRFRRRLQQGIRLLAGRFRRSRRSAPSSSGSASRATEPVGGWPIHASFELHIEQGPILEDELIDVGVVTHGQGQRWYEIRLTGFESHAGSTPMPRRKDALLGAARIVELVNQIGLSKAPLGGLDRGHAQSLPEFAQRDPGRGLHDLRVPPSRRRHAVGDGCEAEGRRRAVCKKIGLTYDLKQVFYYPPVEFDKDCVAAVRRAAKHFGYSHRDIVSGAGHDACYLARVTPTSMIFTPCVDGVSHNESEDIKQDWSTAGANVLMHAVLEKAEIAA